MIDVSYLKRNKMPKCIDCKYYDGAGNKCNSHGKSPIRKCIDAIIDSERNNIKSGMRVLEIGSGVNDYFRKMVSRNNGIWYGVDRKEKWIKINGNVSGYVGSGQDIQNFFDIESLDYIYCGQVLEHMESIDVIEKTIEGSHALLREGGTLQVNVPIYSHGLDIFVKYDEHAIKKLFLKNAWKDFQLEEWRKEHYPLEKYDPLVSGKSEFILQIRCRK